MSEDLRSHSLLAFRDTRQGFKAETSSFALQKLANASAVLELCLVSCCIHFIDGEATTPFHIKLTSSLVTENVASKENIEGRGRSGGFTEKEVPLALFTLAKIPGQPAHFTHNPPTHWLPITNPSFGKVTFSIADISNRDLSLKPPFVFSVLCHVRRKAHGSSAR